MRQGIDQEILNQVVDRYRLKMDDLNFIGGFNNYVYEYQKDSNSYILRIAKDSLRDPGAIRGEVDWINYLYNQGLNVCYAINSARNNLVEVMETEEHNYSIVAFIKAQGRRPTDQDWNKNLFYKMGQLVGKMHNLTKDYQPTRSRDKRPEWDDELDNFIAKHRKLLDIDILDKFNELRQYPEGFSKDKDSYGLVHCDVHAGNFFIGNTGQLQLFDFDDSQYSWYVEDIAMALFYGIFDKGQEKKDIEEAQYFYNHFMDGYSSQNSIDKKWLKEIPYFLKQREINLYIAFMGAGMLNVEFMKDRRFLIENDIPYIDINFV